MARPKAPGTSSRDSRVRVEMVSGNRSKAPGALTASAAVYRPGRAVTATSDRHSIAKEWQIEAYRQVNICGEARYAAALFSATAARAEIGVAEPQSMVGKPNWVTSGPEVEALAELAPTVRERVRLIRDYMLHYVIAGECYLIARDKQETDADYIPPPDGFQGTWAEYINSQGPIDLYNGEEALVNPNTQVWEIVAVTEIMKVGTTWRVRHDNNMYIELGDDDPVIRMWNPDPEHRREAWSPFLSMLPTLREIEWLTKHIFSQVRSRLMSAGVWFLPENITFAPPPVDAVEGGAEAIAAMNEAEQFMMSLAASSTQLLEGDEVAFPSIVMADAAALASVDQQKLIQFWSKIDDNAMVLRSEAIKRFALGMDLPPEQVLGVAGLQGAGTAGRSGTVNHWGMWANEEQTISDHIEPALDTFVQALTTSFLRSVVPGTTRIIAYDTATLRLRQDRSKEAMEWYDRGQLKAKVALRENGFDPDTDMMDDTEFKRWLLVKMLGGSPSPEMMVEAMRLLGQVFELPTDAVSGNDKPAAGQPGRHAPPSLDEHPYEGPPRVQHDHSPAPYGAMEAASEVLVLRALEKAGNVLLNSGKRGRDRDRSTPAHMAHVVATVEEVPTFDFSLASTVFGDLPAAARAEKERQLTALCNDLYKTGTPYTREALIAAVSGL